MFNSIVLNIFFIILVIGIGMVIYYLISNKKPVIVEESLLSQGVENLTGLAAFGFALASISLSIGFAIVLAYHFFLTPIFIVMFASFAIMEFIGSAHLKKAWMLGRIGTVIFSGFLIIGGVGVSILAGQSLLQITEDMVRQKHIQESDEYNAFVIRRESANQAVQNVAISSRELSQAQMKKISLDEKKKLLDEQLEILTNKLKNCPKNYFKKCINPTQESINVVISKIENIQDQYSIISTVFQQSEDYEAAKELASELNNQSFAEHNPTVGVASGINALAIVLRSNPDEVQAHVFLVLAILCEFFAIIGFYLWGQSRIERAHGHHKEFSVFQPTEPVKVSINSPSENESGGLFARVTELVKQGQLEPTLIAVQNWGTSEGKNISEVTIRLWQEIWLNEGVMENYLSKKRH